MSYENESMNKTDNDDTDSLKIGRLRLRAPKAAPIGLQIGRRHNAQQSSQEESE